MQQRRMLSGFLQEELGRAGMSSSSLSCRNSTRTFGVCSTAGGTSGNPRLARFIHPCFPGLASAIASSTLVSCSRRGHTDTVGFIVSPDDRPGKEEEKSTKAIVSALK